MGGHANSITEGRGRPLRRARLWTAALAASATAALLAAVPAARAPQFVSGVNLVEVYVSVTDERGEPVQGLRQEDFEVSESGVPQEISAFTAGEFPLSVAVAVDRSFSMAGERLHTARVAAQTFLVALRPEDEAMVLAIGSEVDVVAPLSRNRRAQFDAVGALDAFGSTAMHDAILEAIGAVQQAKGRRALLLLSDGTDKYSQATETEVLERARRSDVMVYPVAFGRTRPPLFAELATLSGGRSFHEREPQRIVDTMGLIARELRHQYLIGYTPSRPIVAGREEWRSIEVRVDRPRLRVRARDGYLAR